MASAADEAAEHHNQPGSLPNTIVVNAVEGPASLSGVGVTNTPPSYLQLDGCTNFGTRVDVSVPATSCSSEATGKSSGVAGLIYSAALNACGAPLYGSCPASGSHKLAAASDCTRVDGTPARSRPTRCASCWPRATSKARRSTAPRRSAQNAPSSGARAPTKAKAARPTTSTRPPNRNAPAAWGWPRRAPTRTSTRCSPPTSTAA